MALTPSTMLELGTQAPNFLLIEPATQNKVSLSHYKNQPVLVAFICNHCPYVVLLKEALAQFANDYQPLGLQVIAINSNDASMYPNDSPAKMIEDVDTYQYSFPYLYDETQEVAVMYQAACTPDFYMFDDEHKLYYRGQFDSARPGLEIEVTGVNMRQAADSLLKNEAAPLGQIPSIGCSIKWKPGASPDYA